MAHKKISWLIVVVLFALLLCPLMAAASAPKSSSCHNVPEKAPSNQQILVCCDNPAIQVQQVHATVLLPLVQLLNDEAEHDLEGASGDWSFAQFIFRSASDQLAPPSVLRL